LSPHRTPGEALPNGPAPLKKGPAQTCKGCGASAVPDRVDVAHSREPHHAWMSLGRHALSPLPPPQACTPAERVEVGKRSVGIRVPFLWFWTRTVPVEQPFYCCEPGEHLHERCKVCGLRWLTAFAEGS
jgi:hypothetical protein